MKRRWIVTSIAILLLGAACYLNGRIHRMERREVEDFFYLPIDKYAQLISFGYNNVLADIIWMKTLVYTGEHLKSDRNFKYLVSLLNAVTSLDPRFFYPYRFAGTILPWEAHDTDSAIKILQKGLRYLPDNWYLWFITGFIYLYFKENYRKAAFYFKEAATKPGRPLFVVSLAGKLLAKENDADTALKILWEVYKNTRNEETKRKILRRIKMIIAERNFRILEDAVSRFRKREGRLPESLNELVQKGYLREIPPEPFGGKYYLTQDGEVRSTVYNKRIKIYLKR